MKRNTAIRSLVTVGSFGLLLPVIFVNAAGIGAFAVGIGSPALLIGMLVVTVPCLLIYWTVSDAAVTLWGNTEVKITPPATGPSTDDAVRHARFWRAIRDGEGRSR